MPTSSIRQPQVCVLGRAEPGSRARGSGEGEEYFLAPEKLVHGNPKQTIWMQYTDGRDKLFSGLWRRETGK